MLQEQVNHLLYEMDQLRDERQVLLKQLEKKADFVQKQEFEDSALVRDFEVAISTLNLEIQKCKKEHKAEMTKLKSDHEKAEATLKEEIKRLQAKDQRHQDQIQEAHKAMQMIADRAQTQLDEKHKKIKSLEEYQETYRRHIQNLEEQMASFYYAESAEHKLHLESQVKSPVDAKNVDNPYEGRAHEEQPSFLSPLNFSKLAIGGDSKEQSVEEEERQEQKSIVILETVLSSNSNHD